MAIIEPRIVTNWRGPQHHDKKFFEKRNFQLYQDDCFERLKKIYDESGASIDLVFADPPYFLSNGGFSCHAGKRVTVHKGDWDKSPGLDEMHQFNKKWLLACQKLLHHNGSIVISGTHHVIFSIGFALQELGFKILNIITWEKPNPAPNLSCRYLTHSTEQVIWASKNLKAKHKYNYTLMRQINDGKQMKDVWRFTSPKNDEKTFGKHPTQKPISLLERIVLMTTDEGDTVLDPFNGSGTTGLAAIKHNRKYIGIEKEKEYFELTISRVQHSNDLWGG